MKSYGSDDGVTFPLMLILLMIIVFFVGSYAVRYTVKMNTLDNLKSYYYDKVEVEIKER